ncbi:chemotaxis protein CheW [Kineococcus sp. SYSU DK002]|uniref:chemotaxis protein CheW n=1 Tax=Kineococcus sp. SYSU DK002 TaxID=3383123 RepID=UPI003D7D843A
MSAGPTRVGLLRVGGALVALPVDVLREVVPVPERFDALPTDAPGLVGALLLRDRVLPVLDLGALTGRARTATAVQEAVRAAMGVVVLVHEGRALGLLVDSVHDVVDLGPGALQATADAAGPGERPRLFAATFVRPGTDEIGSLLDPAAVLGSPGVLAVSAGDVGGAVFTGDDGPAAGPAVGSTVGSVQDPACLVVRCTSRDGRQVLLAVDVADVQTTLPALAPRPSQLSSDLCLGVTDYGDVRLPVVDPLALLELTPADPSGSWQALLVRSERGLLALVFDEALDIVRVGAGAQSPPPPGRGRVRGAVRSVARLPQGPAFVLDVAALLADEEVSALTALNTSARAGSGTDRAAEHAPHDPVVVFRAHGALTAPLAQVDGVVPFPADPVPWIGGSSDLGALVTEHDVVPLVDLARELGRGRSPEPRSGVVLLVRPPAPDPDAAPRRVGFVVEGLSDIERPVWREDLAEAAAEERSPLVRTGSATGPLLACVDLHALAARLVHPAATGYAAHRG